MFARDAGRALGVALCESGVLYQPGRRQLAAIRSGIAGQLQTARSQSRREPLEERLRHNRVLEERSSTAGIVVVGDNQHRLAMTGFTHRRPHLGESWFACMI